MPTDQLKLRNIAIIAHVDHGKTTLVDGMLKQSHTFQAHQKEMTQTTILDSNDLERERGVTILAKNTAVLWKEYKFNILDTPGHADFSGEVERVLNMADGCILLVDAAEGVLSQTRYVLSLALLQGLRPIVVVNKVDRKDQRVEEVINEITDLFLELATTEEQLDFPILYAVGINGIAGHTIEQQSDYSLAITDSSDLTPLFQTIVDKIPAPVGDASQPLQVQITSLDYDDYKGKYVIGRIRRGTIHKGETLAIVRKGEKVGQARVEYLFEHLGLNRVEVDESYAGEIVAMTGFKEINIGDTLTHMDTPEGLPELAITEPTVQIQFAVSNSPFVGKEGQFSTSRQIRERLTKELETNVGLRINTGPTAESLIVAGRGELHLAILIETMRREGYEFSVSRPEVIFRQVEGHQHEPWELVTIDVPETFAGVVTTSMGQRKGTFKNMHQTKTGTRYEYEIATRNLIGFRSDFQTQTSGMGVVNSLFIGYKPMGETAPWNRDGVIVSADSGVALSYGLQKAQERGITFVEPGTAVYAGMIVGKNSKKEDLYMNVTKGKKLTNMRASSADATVRMTPPTILSLEQALNFLAADELLEVTPQNLRLRKRDLNAKH